MADIVQLLERWQLEVGDLRERVSGANPSGARAMAWAMVVGPEGGRPLKWLRLWRESLIPSETGWTTFAKAGPKVWSLEQTGGSPPS